MPEIKTFVFFDIETTGLPYKEKNQTKIIEFSFVATSREFLEVTPHGFLPPYTKLSFVLNPQRPIPQEVTELTGITTRQVVDAPIFQDKIKSIISFLQDLPGPVCLVAHNGNSFDYKILLAEFNDAYARLPEDLLCVDSLVGLRKILQQRDLQLPPPPPSLIEDLMTDDEDESWPDLDISKEDWDDIDVASLSLSKIGTSLENSTKQEEHNNKINRSAVIRKVFSKEYKVKESYKLTDIYKKLLNRVEENAHRAEADCMMLLKCVVAVKENFLMWADSNCKYLTDIKPLIRGATFKYRI